MPSKYYIPSDADKDTEQSKSLFDELSTPILAHFPKAKKYLDERAQPTLKESEGNVVDDFLKKVLPESVSSVLPTTAAKFHGFSTGALEAITPSHLIQAASLGQGGVGATANLVLGAHSLNDAKKSVEEGNYGTAGLQALGGLAGLVGGGADASRVITQRAAKAAEAAAAAKAAAPVAAEVDDTLKMVPSGLRVDFRNLRAKQVVKVPERYTTGPFKGIPIVKNAPEDLAAHAKLAKEIEANPEGGLNATLGGPKKPATLVDIEKDHAEATKLVDKNTTQEARNLNARDKFVEKSQTQEARNANAKQKYILAQQTQDAKNANKAADYLAKAQVQDARNLNARDKFVANGQVQEARNLNARDKFVEKDQAQTAKNLNARNKYLEDENNQFAANEDARQAYLDEDAAQQARNLNARDAFLAQSQKAADKAVEEEAAKANVNRMLRDPNAVVRESASQKIPGSKISASRTLETLPPEGPAGDLSALPSTTPKAKTAAGPVTDAYPVQAGDTLKSYIKRYGLPYGQAKRKFTAHMDKLREAELAAKESEAAGGAASEAMSPEVEAEVRRIHDELETQQFNPRVWTENPQGKGNGAGGKFDIRPGTPNADVYADIVAAGGPANGPTMREHIKRLLEGDLANTKAQQAVRKVAEERLARASAAPSEHIPAPTPLSPLAKKLAAEKASQAAKSEISTAGVPKKNDKELADWFAEQAAADKAAAAPVKPRLTYDEFSKQYRQAFADTMKYSPNEVGSQVYTDKMAALADEFPSYLTRFEDAEEAGSKVAPAPVVDTLPTGEGQPRLPEAGGVRDTNVPTPKVADVPFGLTPPPVKAAPEPVEASLLEPPAPKTSARVAKAKEANTDALDNLFSATHPGEEGAPKINPTGHGTIPVRVSPTDTAIAKARARYSPEMNTELDRVGEAYRAASGPEKRELGKQLAQLKAQAETELAAKTTAANEAELAKLVAMSPEERKAAIIKMTRGGELGESQLKLLMHLAGGGAGAIAGAAYDDEDPFTGAAIGGIGGALAPSLIGKLANLKGGGSIKDFLAAAKERIPNYNRGGLLSDPRSIVNNAYGGPWGSGFFTGLEQAIGGSPDVNGVAVMKDMLNAPKLLKRFRSNLGRAWEAVGENERADYTAPEKMTWLDKLFGIPAKYMTAGDMTVRDVLKEHGMAENMARQMTATSEPGRIFPWAKNIENIGKAKGHADEPSMALQMALPFKRTTANLGELGTERFPLIGEYTNNYKLRHGIPGLSGRMRATQQGIGAGVLGASGLAGYNIDPEDARSLKLQNLASNIAGPYAVPANIGFAVGQALQAGKDPAKAFMNSAMEGMPLPTAQPIKDVGNPILKALFGEEVTDKDIPKFLTPKVITLLMSLLNDDK